MDLESIDIYRQDDLDKLVHSGIINCNIVVRGEQNISFNKVNRINGTLGICDSNIENLGSLEIISGDFWISILTIYPRLESLGNVKEIGGDATFRYSNLSDVGKLRKVVGRLSLRDTPIENLGNLEYVGKDLFLPMRFKERLDTSKISIGGNIRFWNDNKNRAKLKSKEELGLKKHNEKVPYWNHKYIFSKDELENVSYDQRKFYQIYKESFLNGKMLDVEGNDNYTFVLFYDLISTFQIHRDIKLLELQFKKLESYYPKTKGYTQRTVIEYFESKSDFENAWKLKYNETYISIDSIIKYQEKLKRPLLDSNLIIKLGGYSHLTDFGQKNIENIKPFGNEQLKIYEKDKKNCFFDSFYIAGKPYQKKENNYFKSFFKFNRKKQQSIGYDAYYYKQFYLSESEYNHYKSIDDNQFKSGYKSDTFHVVEKAILNQFRLITKKAEDLYRESIGMPKVGEGWISETELFYLISDFYSKYMVIHHASPKWLGRQHLDIYMPELNICIEYQGAQHYEPVDFFGGQEAFEKTKERDERKRLKCIENRCALIYVNEGCDFEDIKNKINKIIINGVQNTL
jgi:hypothetical protein